MPLGHIGVFKRTKRAHYFVTFKLSFSIYSVKSVEDDLNLYQPFCGTTYCSVERSQRTNITALL
jgi:hypothetical protein